MSPFNGAGRSCFVGVHAQRFLRRARKSCGTSTLEIAILMPITLLIMFFMVQVGLYWHVSNVVGAAAEAGVNAGQVEGATEADVEAAVDSILVAATTRETPDVVISIDPPGTNGVVTVTVTAKSIRIMGLGDWEVRSEAVGRVEEFIPAGER